MALEAVVYQQQLFGHNNGKDLYTLLENWSCDLYAQQHHAEVEEEKEESGGPHHYDQYYDLNFQSQADHHHQNFYGTLFPYWDDDSSSQLMTPKTFPPDQYCGGPNSLSPSQESSNDIQFNGPAVVPNIAAAPPTTILANSTTAEDAAPVSIVLLQPIFDPAAAAENTTTENSSCTSTTTRPKRIRRARSRKNKEEIENQRITHIAVERNRRKQMNEYLSMLKRVMPESYVHRGDQASIIGGAINFVRELEQKMQCLSAYSFMHMDQNPSYLSETTDTGSASNSSVLPFEEYFSFPQYTAVTASLIGADLYSKSTTTPDQEEDAAVVKSADHQNTGSHSLGLADIEVTMVESHASLKIRTKQRSTQLRKLVSGLQKQRLTVLHLNVSTADHISLYSITVKVEDDSKLTSVDEIATAVNDLLSRIVQQRDI